MHGNGGWPPSGGQLMPDHLVEDRTGVLIFRSPRVTRSTETYGEWKDGPFGPPWAEAGEEVVRRTRSCSRRGLLLIETKLYAGVLTCHFIQDT